MLNDAVTNDWLLRSPFTKAKKGELITVAHESKRKITASADDEQKLLDQCKSERRKHLGTLIIAPLILAADKGNYYV
jgi:hypothetical protein